MSGSIISFVSPTPELTKQQAWWTTLVEHWPAFAPPPALQRLALDQALCEPHEMHGSVAVIVSSSDAAVRTCILKLLDVLDARMMPTILLTTPDDADLAALSNERVIVIPQNTTPDVLASAIFALCVRQPAIDSLLSELRTMRRFHGGLRDEMDRLQEELQLAAHVQQQFIPRSLPEIDGIEFGVLFRPCGYVSGDIYDVARITDELVGFFIADAVGHGVPAALMTMVLSKAMPALDNDGKLLGPAESLKRLNAALMKRTGRVQTFATAVCGVINPSTGQVTIAGAGHPPPLRISGGAVSRVETNGSLLGVFEDGEFNEVAFTLSTDEILLMHSDGFETAFPDPVNDRSRKSPSTRYLDHFRELREAREETDVKTAVAALARALDEQAGSLHQIDDETALVIGRRPAEAVSRAA